MVRTLRTCIFAGILSVFSGSYSFADILYTAVRGVGTGTVNLSITTDGTLGVLATANIIDWTIGMTDGLDSFTLLGPMSGSNSVRAVVGSSLTATASDLLFNFDAAAVEGPYFLIQSPAFMSGKLFWAVQNRDAFDVAGPAEAIDPRNDFTFVREPYTGNRVIASSRQFAAVPEPASLTLVILGAVCLVIGAARRRRQKQSA